MKSIKKNYVYNRLKRTVERIDKSDRSTQINMRMSLSEYTYLRKLAAKRCNGNLSLLLVYCALFHNFDD